MDVRNRRLTRWTTSLILSVGMTGAVQGQTAPPRPSGTSTPPPAIPVAPVLPPSAPPSANMPRPAPGALPPSGSRMIVPPQSPPPEHIIDGRTFDLSTLQGLSQELSPNLREAAASVEVARGQALQAGLYPNPQISHGNPQGGPNVSQYYQYLSQDIVTAGKLRLSRAAAERQVTQQELAFVRTRFDLLTAVRAGFYTTLAAQRKVEILRELVTVVKKSQESAVKLQQGGEGTKTDVLLLDIELERAQVALSNAEAILAASKKQLAASIGDPSLPILAVQGSLVEPLPEFQFDALRDGILRENALVSIAQIEVDRAQVLLRRARVEPIPNVTLLGGYQYSVEFPRNQFIYQVILPIPVFNRNQGNIRSARSNITKSAEGLQRIQNELSGQSADALGRHMAARQLVERYEQQILPKASLTQQLAQQGYQLGQFEFLRLLTAQKTLVETNLGYVTSQELRWTTAAEIAGLLQLEEFPPTAAPSDAGSPHESTVQPPADKIKSPVEPKAAEKKKSI